MLQVDGLGFVYVPPKMYKNQQIELIQHQTTAYETNAMLDLYSHCHDQQPMLTGMMK